jgi:hypothetical protein
LKAKETALLSIHLRKYLKYWVEKYGGLNILKFVKNWLAMFTFLEIW